MNNRLCRGGLSDAQIIDTEVEEFRLLGTAFLASVHLEFVARQTSAAKAYCSSMKLELKLLTRILPFGGSERPA